MMKTVTIMLFMIPHLLFGAKKEINMVQVTFYRNFKHQITQKYILKDDLSGPKEKYAILVYEGFNQVGEFAVSRVIAKEIEQRTIRLIWDFKLRRNPSQCIPYAQLKLSSNREENVCLQEGGKVGKTFGFLTWLSEIIE